MDFQLLTELIDAFKNYQLSLPGGKKSSLVDFSIWVNEQQYGKGISADNTHSDIIGRNDIDVEIGKLIIYMNRYAKLLIKKGLAEFPELANEDFTYLYTLMSAESMTKIQLIEKNVHEKPSGLEVIKRLLKYGLIDEKNDLNDKRSKRVFVTDKGKGAFIQTLDRMGKVSKVIAGNLSKEEKQTLFILLKKLEGFHNSIFLKDKKSSLEELLSTIR